VAAVALLTGTTPGAAQGWPATDGGEAERSPCLAPDLTVTFATILGMAARTGAVTRAGPLRVHH
jgi:hypothetical protein